ncbi:hypothetical protein BSR28_03970 [Boudabousia liubingyangii]|uniref:AMP-dependent synthetase/ligase n=1 Tax=Boudabousia liubingyangii TaxID=1921764 RepID=UPI00093B6C72|nr:AMP-dependent synthetase/ligase [Boudabousia liubingyangii]OKL47653.1 hypothetical protein BSR28_03970 [Boudabousia liubingyangii]
MSIFSRKSKIVPQVPAVDTIGELLQGRLKRAPKANMVYRKSSVGRSWVPATVTEVLAQVDAISKGLLGLGFQKGDALAIMGSTSFDWMLLDLAAVQIGLISVPIYESDSAAQISHILKDADIKLVVTQSATQAALVQSCQPDDQELQILSFDDSALAMIIAAGSKLNLKQVVKARENVSGSDLATIVYTSGTTGAPKGVELTHYNFAKTIYDIQFIAPQLLLDRSGKLLLFLPVAHVLARYVQFAILASESALAQAPDVKNLLSDMQSFAPTAIMVVPRVLEKIKNAAAAKAPSGFKRRVFKFAENTAIAYSQALEEPQGPSWGLRRKHALASKLVLNKLKQAFGPEIDLVVCGGAPLDANLGHFFRGVGLDLIEGYGMTETTGPATVNRPGHAVMGSVGTLLQGTEVKFTDEGEICLRGAQITKGYHNLPAATAQAIDGDGWLHTGDLGHLDAEGHLVITGRAKDLLVTAGGKNVSPGPLEAQLRLHPLISQAVVLGDMKPFISALVALDAEALPTWLRAHSLPPMDATSAVSHPRVKASIEKAVKRANASVSRAESIREFRIVPGDFTEANGLLTPSLKVKRPAVLERFADTVKEIYGEK